MPDAADIVTEQEARAVENFLAERRREQLIVESMRGFDPTIPLYCDDCGEQIPPERLAAYPKANRCTPCSAKKEAEYRARWPK